MEYSESLLSLQTPAATIVPGLPLRLGDKDEGEFGHRALCNLIEIALINLFVLTKLRQNYKLQSNIQNKLC